jgi:putative hydroxymethylpyrimidine transporter CytX
MLLLWLGASISISEIITGGLLAPLGFAGGLAALIAGHVIGTALLALGGYISFFRGKNAMDSVAFSLGAGGGKLVALCNVIQLLGWTIVMAVQAARALTGLIPQIPFWTAALILSLLVLIWALIFGSPAGRLNDVIVLLLAGLCILLFIEAAGSGAGFIGPETMNMTLGIELSIAMPVSWLPLIGDYTSKTKSKFCAAGMPFAGYFTGSVLMYAFGLFIALSGGGDFFTFIASSRFRVPACGVVAFSTLTTAFLDLYSAAVSSEQLIKTKNPRLPILVIGVFAVLGSVFFPVEAYGEFLINFLTAIGMVFVPVYTILFIDFFMKKNQFEKVFHWTALGIALAGMAVYRFFSVYEIWIPTVISMVLVAALYVPLVVFQAPSRKRLKVKG